MELNLKNVRLAFSQNLFVAGLMKNSKPGDTPKFSCSFLIAKTDPQIETVKKVLQAVAVEKWKDKAGSVLKLLNSEGKVCFKDGDLKAEYDGFDGCMYVQASSKQKPLIIDRDRTPLNEEDGKPYAGCYVNCKIDIWAQDNGFGKRINGVLKGVQFFADGDAFSGSSPAKAEEFEDLGNTGDDLAG